MSYAPTRHWAWLQNSSKPKKYASTQHFPSLIWSILLEEIFWMQSDRVGPLRPFVVNILSYTVGDWHRSSIWQWKIGGKACNPRVCSREVAMLFLLHDAVFWRLQHCFSYYMVDFILGGQAGFLTKVWTRCCVDSQHTMLYDREPYQNQLGSRKPPHGTVTYCKFTQNKRH